MITELSAGFFSGIISGMGIGGGTILIPALTMFLNVGQHIAQGVNLLYFLPTSIVALCIHKKNNVISFKTAIPVILFGIIGSALGAFTAIKLEATLLRRLFGIFLLIMGIYEIHKGFKKKKDSI